MSKGKGRLVYLSIPALKGLEELGSRYITRDFCNKKHTSYNRAVLLLLKFVKIGENIPGLKIKRDVDKDEK